MTTIKQKICKECKSKFTPIRSTLEPVCSNYQCKVDYALKVVAKNKANKEKEQKRKSVEDRKVLRDKLKTLGQYEAEAKSSFQKYIRLRDFNLNCISCNGNEKNLWDGGHYFKAELFSGLIFDERNCHKQCRKCNRFLGGNEIQYRMGLISRYGKEFVEQLELDSVEKRVYKYSKEELIRKKIEYDIKIKELN